MEELATTREVAAHLRVKTQTLDAWASQGKGPAFTKIGGARRYSWPDVRSFTQSGKTGITGPILTCNVCKAPVETDGYITVHLGSVFRVQKNVREFEARQREGGPVPTDEALWDRSMDPVPWRVLHRACDPDMGGNDYWYGIERVNTWPGFASFLAHVIGKGWARHTNFPALLRRVGGNT